MKHKTETLEGALLDRAVAKAAGFPVDSDGDRLDERNNGGAPLPFHPSTDWRDGGPIIEREGISLHKEVAPDLYNEWGDRPPFPITWEARCVMSKMTGPTPLVAAMRAFVASKLGEKAELP